MRYFVVMLLLTTLAAGADVTLRGNVPKPLDFTSAELQSFPHQSVRVKDKDYSGVPLRDLLARAGVVSPDEKHSQNIPYYLVVEAKDGYRAVFALVELDPLYSDELILLTDGGRLIVPHDKLPGRCVKDVVRLTVQRLP